MANVPKILVIGVGGGGNNALDRMIESKLSSVNYLAVNTDAQVLMECKAEEKLQIGKKLTRGYGAGADPQVGEAAAIESEEEIRAMVKNMDMCIITCGTYGGTVEVRGEYNRYSAVPSRHGTEKALIYAEKEENILFFFAFRQEKFVYIVQNLHVNFYIQNTKLVFTNTDACCNNIANRYKKRKIHTEINNELCRKILEGREITMKIVFWSNYPKSDVTSNMTAVCVMFSILFPTKVMMMTNHCNHGNLGRTLLGRCYDEVLREESGYRSGAGLYPTVKRIEDTPSCFSIPKSAENLAEDGLYYFAQGKLFSNEIYELRVMEELNRFMEYLNESEDYIFIDAKSQDSISTARLLEEADIVVVNLKQDEMLMRDFFRKYAAITGKAFFFISEYKHRKGYTKNKFVNEFSIHPNRVAVIPYNPEFVPLVDDGRITEYVMRNHDCKKNTKEYYYIWHLKKAARLLKKILDHQPQLAIATEKQYA